jgi:hypothetical protein
MKNIITIILVLALAACGFQPLYAEQQNNKSILVGSSFDIQKIDKFGRAGQKLQYELEDLLNYSKGGEKKYRLVVAPEKTKEGIGIQKDRFITRYNLRVRATYQVFDIASNRKIFDGATQAVGSFNAVDSDFGTYSLEENTLISLMDELAKDITLSISTKLSDAKSVENLAAEQAEKDKVIKEKAAIK